MLRQARHFNYSSRQGWIVELVNDSTETFLTGHIRLRRANQKARRRRPDIARALTGEITRFVQMSAGDEGNSVPPHQSQKRSARLGLDRPIAGVALVRAVEEQRSVQEPGNPSLSCVDHCLFEPRCLRVLLRFAAA